MNRGPWCALVGLSLLVGCGDSAPAEETGGAGGNGGAGASGGLPPIGGAATCEGTCDVPPGGTELQAFLLDGGYKAFDAEPAPHPSDGPHFGIVRTFFSPKLMETASGGPHGIGAATVKELYDGEGDDVVGWSVWVRVADEGTADDLYWYEVYEGSQYADGVGAGACVGCHGGGDDFLLSSPP